MPSRSRFGEARSSSAEALLRKQESRASAIAVCVSPNPPTGGGDTIPQLAQEALLRGLIPFLLNVEFDSQGQVKGYLNINLHGSYG